MLFCLLLCASSIFTALFSRESESYINFSTSFRTLFQSMLGEFEMEDFGKYQPQGALLLGIFLLISSIMMLNLLIALLGNVYSVLAERVDGEYNVNIINLYSIWNWDDNFGFFIFL